MIMQCCAFSKIVIFTYFECKRSLGLQDLEHEKSFAF